MPDGDAAEETGRYRQRRRTRAAIVSATMTLIAEGAELPTITEIAEAADMSRRTVYLHFPSIDQLLIDATAGLLSQQSVAEAIAAADPGGQDPHARVEAMIRALAADMSAALPLGRQMIRLTVGDPPRDTGGPRRGYRRIEWIEQALDPLRERLSDRRFETLVSALAMTIGWEAEIVLADIRDLDAPDRIETMVWAARALIDAAVTGE